MVSASLIPKRGRSIKVLINLIGHIARLQRVESNDADFVTIAQRIGLG
jgi:hypothetical protein